MNPLNDELMDQKGMKNFFILPTHKYDGIKAQCTYERINARKKKIKKTKTNV